MNAKTFREIGNSGNVYYLITERILKHEHTGRHLGSEKFMLRLEKMLDIMLKPKGLEDRRKRKLISMVSPDYTNISKLT